MATIKALEYEAARAIKTWRNHRAGFRPIDQSAEAFYGVSGRAEEAGALIVGAVAHRFFYQLSGEAIDIVANAHRGILSPQHLEQMKYLDVGQCVAMLNTTVHTLNVDLTPQERRYLVERQAAQDMRRAA